MGAVTFLVRGIVQGVGFRPFVYRLATEEGLAGSVRNTAEGVKITVEGEAGAIGRFRARLRTELPPLAHIEHLEEAAVASTAATSFRIAASEGASGDAAITPDAALCEACRAELFDPTNRRHRHPFITCTDCGPRFSIVEAVPYDRGATTMRAFPLCPACAAEYADPADRRFHAEAIACPDCGPTLAFLSQTGGTPQGDPIAAALALLRGGGILGVMGLGGFHLAVRAEDAEALMRLRERKRRPSKPFALMVRDLGVAERYGELGAPHRLALAGREAPIILAPARRMPQGVAPGLAEIGLMLPTTPLHALLLEPFDEALVMTSANRSGEPPVTRLAEAQRQLGDVTDGWLVHDRAIANRVDDSLVAVREGEPRLVRRARGYAPAPIALPEGFAPHPPVLAMGGDPKNAFAMAADGRALLSPHIGDLASRAVERDLERQRALLAQMSNFAPALVAVDAHPAYRSRRIGEREAARLGVPCETVGHHHAHIASCLAENGIARTAPPVLALTLDGLGAAPDGRLLGCELWRADYREATHLGGLRPTALLGGDKAALEPWRNLLARLDDAGDRDDWPRHLAARLDTAAGAATIAALLSARGAGIASPSASSAGRLFDAVAATLDLCRTQDYEGEAPMRLEALADAEVVATAAPYPMSVASDGARWTLDPAPMWAAIDADLGAGANAAHVACRFHRGLADGLLALVAAVRTPQDGAIALSGGTFHNAVLAGSVRRGCAALGLRVLEHRRVPAGDGGLALGQAAIAIARWRAGESG